MTKTAVAVSVREPLFMESAGANHAPMNAPIGVQYAPIESNAVHFRRIKKRLAFNVSRLL